MIYKSCGCGREYTLAEWEQLPYVVRDKDAGLELRDCVCSSTLALTYATFPGDGRVIRDDIP